MNKMLMQEKMMNQMMYMNQLGQMMPNPIQNYPNYQYQQGFHPLSYSNVTSTTSQQQNLSPSKIKTENYNQNNS